MASREREGRSLDARGRRGIEGLLHLPAKLLVLEIGVEGRVDGIVASASLLRDLLGDQALLAEVPNLLNLLRRKGLDGTTTAR